MKTISTTLFVGLLIISAAGDTAAARGGPPGNGGPRWSLSMTPVYQWDAKLDQGGEFSSDRLFLSLQMEKWFGSSIGAGLGIEYGYEDYDFEGVTGFGANPWNTLHRFVVSFPFSYQTESDWLLLFSPSVEMFGESGADSDESLGYGAVAVAIRRFDENLRLGIGLGAFRRIEKNTYFPFLAIRWQITDRVRLSNPFRAGPSGPAGLELVFDMGDGWELGAGGAWRSYRFRLDREGTVPNGIGETEQLPAFLRAGKRLRDTLRLDFYLGAALAGELTLKNSAREELVVDDFDTAPFAGVSLSGEF